MLMKDRKERLGQNDDMDEILLHPFFSDVDVSGLLNKKVEPPFIPQIKDKKDLRNFDPEVTQQQLAESILPQEAKHMIAQKAGAFDDFGPVMRSEDSHEVSQSKKGHSSGSSGDQPSAAGAAAAGNSKAMKKIDDQEEKKDE